MSEGLNAPNPLFECIPGRIKLLSRFGNNPTNADAETERSLHSLLQSVRRNLVSGGYCFELQGRVAAEFYVRSSD